MNAQELSTLLAKEQPDSQKRCLFFCNRTANIMQPWAENGYSCFAFDLQHTGIIADGNYYFIQADVHNLRDLDLPSYFGMAFPDCTNLAGSGARWWREKGEQAGVQGLYLALDCEEILKKNCSIWAWENPVGRAATKYRKPDYTFDPADYGDPYTKKTCLWTSSTFRMPEKKRVEVIDPLYIRDHASGKNRKNTRSITPPGFCKAVYLANRKV